MHEIKTEVDRDDLVSEKHAYHSYEGTEDDDHWRQTQPGRSKQGRNSLDPFRTGWNCDKKTNV